MNREVILYNLHVVFYKARMTQRDLLVQHAVFNLLFQPSLHADDDDFI